MSTVKPLKTHINVSNTQKPQGPPCGKKFSKNLKTLENCEKRWKSNEFSPVGVKNIFLWFEQKNGKTTEAHKSTAILYGGGW